MAIDLHCHWVPESLATALRARAAPPRIRSDAGTEVFDIVGTTLPFGPEFHSIERRIERMDRDGVELQVLSLPGLFGIDSLPVEEATPLCELFNREAATLVASSGGRFLALASLPLADPGSATRTLETAGLSGAILPADAFRSAAAALHLAPLLAAADRARAHLFVHPGPLPGGSVPAPTAADCVQERRVTLRTQARLSEAALTLALSGILDPHPHVTVQVANLGGSFPFLLERMDHVARVRQPDQPPPSERMRRLWYDGATFGPAGLALAVARLGADRVVFGSDDPVFSSALALEAIAAADLSSTEREALLRGNARALLGA